MTIVSIIRHQNNHPWNHKYRYKITSNKFLTLMKLTIVHLEVLPTAHWTLQAPPNSPESPRTNVAVPIPDDLLTEDEGTGDQNVSPTETPVTPDVKGRQETLSPTPQVSQTVWSAIELAIKDFEPSDQRIIDKCGEVDFQLSNH